MIAIINDKGQKILLRPQDIRSVFDVPEKGLTVVNFDSGSAVMAVWTKESADSINEKIAKEHA